MTNYSVSFAGSFLGIFLLLGILGCSSDASAVESGDADMGRTPIQVRQAPTGQALTAVVSQDNVQQWQNFINYPQPGQPLLPDVTLAFRLQSGNFFSAANEPLKVVARIQWSIGNAFDLAVIDIPSNSNIRVPLAISDGQAPGRLIVDLATVLTDTDPALMTNIGTPTDFWENIPKSQFRKAVTGANNKQVIPTASAGVLAGYGSSVSNALPQRQVKSSPGGTSTIFIPRPSGAVNVQYYVPNASTLTFAQTNEDGTTQSVVLGPGITNKLQTDAYAVAVTNPGGAAQKMLLTFDIAF